MNAPKITQSNQNANIRTPEGAAIVKGHQYNLLCDDVLQNETDLDTAEASITVLEGKLLPAGGQQLSANVVEYNTVVTITSAMIIGTAAGDIGHVDGAILVAAPSSDYVLEFVSALFVYDYATGAYNAGGDDIVVQGGAAGTQVALSTAITDANLLTAAGDKILRLGPIDTEVLPLVGGALSIAGTALGTAAAAVGVLRVHLTYRIHTTNL
jgi:hypothetical protein